MNNLDKLANMFKERDNRTVITATIGEVISTSPVRIRYGQEIILEEKMIVIPDHLLRRTESVTITPSGGNSYSATVERPSEILTGKKVAMVPNVSFSKWFVIGIVG